MIATSSIAHLENYGIKSTETKILKMCLFLKGLAQCTELCWQLRGMAEKRQVPNAKLALQHNIGLGGVVVVALYALGFQHQAR